MRQLSIAVVVSSLAGILSACNDASRVTSPEPLNARSSIIESCDPEAKYCDPDDYPAGPAPGIALPFTNSWCRNATTNTPDDIDGDGLRDECAYQLAVAFAPMLVQGNEGWQGTLPAVPGEYLFAVGPSPGSAGIRIAYMPAYYHDLGLVPSHYSMHTGDSEFIIVEVAYNYTTSRWATTAIFLSNHCGAVDPVLGFFSADPNCQWYNPNHFGFVNNVYLGAPRIWVADWKHANYTSYSHCQYGTYTIDTCAYGTRVERRFPVSRDFWLLRNSRPDWSKVPARRATSGFVDPTKLEDFWAGRTETSFNGWQPNQVGDLAQPYGDVLRFFGVYKMGGTPLEEGPCDREAKYCA